MTRTQRENYLKHKEWALNDSDWVTMIVYGLDQNKTFIPKLAQQDQLTRNQFTTKLNVTGGLLSYKKLRYEMGYWKLLKNGDFVDYKIQCRKDTAATSSPPRHRSTRPWEPTLSKVQTRWQNNLRLFD
ncbi:unnamed protein product [Darwinula stevensoni]|uniref:Uncharacterized protein n=1 Tax=Darwinula stevensoni TaxID=69355 RepID=A0A7R9A3B5_9CRUS|nr:unnamed protein product [Darwinula stevensoni]CAG0881769.1 unnamed protein product [Darwinula stevensoni]